MQNIVITFSPKLLYIIFLNENCNYFKSEFTTQMWTNTPPPMSSSKMWALTPGALGFPSGLAEGQKVPAACRTLEPEYHTPSHELVFSQALLLCPPRLRSHPCPPLVPFLPLTTRPPVSPPKPRTLPSTARALPPPCPHGVSAERLPGSAELFHEFPYLILTTALWVALMVKTKTKNLPANAGDVRDVGLILG